jgi:hypothetical protein
VKELARDTSTVEAERVAKAALSLSTADEVASLLANESRSFWAGAGAEASA